MNELFKQMYRVKRSLFQELAREPNEKEIAIRLLEENLEHEPTAIEIEENLRKYIKKVKFMEDKSRFTISLETPEGDGEDEELGYFIEDITSENPQDSTDRKFLKNAIEEFLTSDLLKPKEKRAIRLRFGIGADGPHTLQEVGDIMQVSRERIRQLEKSAFKKFLCSKYKNLVHNFLE